MIAELMDLFCDIISLNVFFKERCDMDGVLG